VRFAKAAELLQAGGALAVVETQHVLPAGGDRFFVEVQEDYETAEPDEDNEPPGPPEAVPDLSAEFAASGVFEPPVVRRYVWEITYTADEYIAVLGTYSGNLALDEHTRRKLFVRIRGRIEARPGGRIHKLNLATLNVGRRL
jgi:hypothetical protein